MIYEVHVVTDWKSDKGSSYLFESEIEEYALKNGIIEKNDYVDFVAIHEDLEK